jgi:signal peptidase II
VKKHPKTVRPFWPFGVLLFVVLLAFDQYTKNHILTRYTLGESHQVLPGVFFTYVQNTGTLWGLFRGSSANMAFIWLSITIFGLLIYFFDRFETLVEKICYSLIMAGLWGNLIDRGMQGFVVDFIDFRWWPVFNIADACIVVGVAVLLIEHFRKSRTR